MTNLVITDAGVADAAALLRPTAQPVRFSGLGRLDHTPQYTEVE